MRASSAAARASRTGSSSTRSSTSWKKPRTIRRSASARRAAGHQIEELLAIDLAERRTVRAANVVGHDLETGDRVRVRGLREEQIAVLLVGVRLLRAFLDADHPAPDRARVVAKRALEREVRGGRRSHVLLERVVVEVLRAVGEVRAGDPQRRAVSCEVVLDPDLALGGAEPPATQSSAASRSTRPWWDAKCHVLRERFCTETYSTFAASCTTISTAAFEYADRSGEDDAYSSISANRLSGSATTSSRQKSDPPSTEFAMRT